MVSYGYNYNYDPNAAAWQNYWTQYYQGINNPGTYNYQTGWWNNPQAGGWAPQTTNSASFAPSAANSWTPQPDAFTPQTQNHAEPMAEPAGGAMNLQDIINQMKQQTPASPEAMMPPVVPPKKKSSKIMGLIKYVLVGVIGFAVAKVFGKGGGDTSKGLNVETNKKVTQDDQPVYNLYSSVESANDDTNAQPSGFVTVANGRIAAVKEDQLKDSEEHTHDETEESESEKK